ncbi:iron chelate uptake ABC transporter family permease subunit [Streptomyces sp. XM4193]|uniref:FecCD family ABC transporter permease n=1 Tax=Streptomyces sp. XM4193 TaxID=2929782 RepID=UPI001FFAA142|nr:iron chelate uptake ABC transporter family permease subunit [Streptomyces sp. XM4193]MCK1794860.1 iron chelate uptake ABC transporter family permease subunit [Streptomyces sp. XM4193]
MRPLVLRAGPVSARVETRTAAVCLSLLVLALALGLVGLCRGDTWDSPATALTGLLGHGDSALVVQQWRLPRVAAALAFGAALGLAGAIFQNLTRNALGSPDIIGLDAGAYGGALFALTVLGGTAGQLAFSSVAGGLLTAAAIYLLSLKSGLSGLRLIVIGVAVNAMLMAFNSWVLMWIDLDVALVAVGWNAGSLNGLGWSDVTLPLLIIAALAALTAALSHTVHQASLGDELALASGVNLSLHRVLIVFAGVACTATVTAVAGPIVFVALAAPQIGRRLAGASGVPLLPAALTGAVLLIAADLTAQTLLAPVALPVGVVTTAIGGCYLIWLLSKDLRKGRTP